MVDSSTLKQKGNKSVITLVSFFPAYGQLIQNTPGDKTEHYTSTNKVIDDIYAPANIELEYAEFTGALEEQPTKLIMSIPSVGSIPDLYSQYRGSPRLYVRIIERTIDKRLGVSEDHTILIGEVSRSIRNYQSKPGRVAFEIINDKKKLFSKNHYRADEDCILTFMGPVCGVTAFTTSVQISTINKHIVTLASDPKPPGVDSRYFENGFVSPSGDYLGLDYKIKVLHYDWTTSPTTLYLAKMPASPWYQAGSNLNLTFGCDYSLFICRNRHDNEANFMGCGYGIAAQDPLLENDVF